MIEDGKGYLTPDPPDPPDVICIKVFIPKDMLYIAAFWGAYQFFTNWNAWARDPLKKGKRAAVVWKRAFEMARAHWLIFQGDCGDMINNLRSKPLEPCILQALNDDGTWVDIFDASCCGGGSGDPCLPQLRVSNGTIERYDPGTGTWVPVGPQTPPVTVPLNPPPYPVSSDGACISATNFGALIENRKNKLAATVSAGLLIGDTILTAFDLLISLTGYGWVLSVIGSLIDGIYQDLQFQYAEVAAYDIEEVAICMALPHYSNDGAMTENHVALFLIDINAYLTNFDPISPQATAWRYVYSWVKAAGPEGMQLAASYMGITEGACDNCTWEQEFDFTVSSWGFARGDYEGVPELNPGGQYVPGSGWKTQLIGDRPFCHVRLLMERTEITGYTFDYTGVRAGVGADDFNYIQVAGATATNAWINGSEKLVYNYDTSPMLEYVEFRLDAYAGESHPDCSCVVHKLRVRGTGQNPFIAALPPA